MLVAGCMEDFYSRCFQEFQVHHPKPLGHPSPHSTPFILDVLDDSLSLWDFFSLTEHLFSEKTFYYNHWEAIILAPKVFQSSLRRQFKKGEIKLWYGQCKKSIFLPLGIPSTGSAKEIPKGTDNGGKVQPEDSTSATRGTELSGANSWVKNTWLWVGVGASAILAIALAVAFTRRKFYRRKRDLKKNKERRHDIKQQGTPLLHPGEI